MTIFSVSSSFIDYAAFGVNPDELRSLSALGAIWRSALGKVAPRGQDAAFARFIEQTAELPTMIGDADWQRSWMQSWYRLQIRGYSAADIICFFNNAVSCCETDLLGSAVQISRVEFDLLGILRRSVISAISCAVELGEEARSAETGLPGEFMALHGLREWLEQGLRPAVLSVSLLGRQAVSHLSASELQSLPGLLADQLAALLRPQDKVFVGHASEWLLILSDIHSMAQPALAAAHIRRAFVHPVQLLSGRSITLNVAIGAAISPEHGEDAEELVSAARLARASLQSSREPFAIFDDAMKVDWQWRHQLSEELRQALRNQSLMAYLQPQLDIASGQCFGAEMLLRWRRANGDWVEPPLIVEIIEENGWRAEFTDWLLRTALRTCADLDGANVGARLSLNLTAGDLLDIDLPELVAQCLETWRLPADRFTFELTESAMMLDHERGLSVMHKLRDMGIRLALDDFGTGYSSLSYLATLPLNEIKIDRSFVIGMSRSAEGLRIVRAIVDLTHDLGMRSLAEGVETESQREQLLALGCTDAQGYLYARPMPLAEFIAWYRGRQA
jgi:EAL domain-containing protein (putative c-di-GMP-specific phosphodiesterase class I)